MKVTSKVAGYIAITAAEGGIGYWSQIDRYEPSRWNDDDTGESKRVARDFAFYNVAEIDNFGSAYKYGEWLVVTPDVIERGVNRFIEGVEGYFEARPFYDMADLSAMDADEADAVIQLGVFGRLVYG